MAKTTAAQLAADDLGARRILAMRLLRDEYEQRGMTRADLRRLVQRVFPGRDISKAQFTYMFTGRGGALQYPPPEILYMILAAMNLDLGSVGLDDADDPFVADALRGHRQRTGPGGSEQTDPELQAGTTRLYLDLAGQERALVGASAASPAAA